MRRRGKYTQYSMTTEKCSIHETTENNLESLNEVFGVPVPSGRVYVHKDSQTTEQTCPPITNSHQAKSDTPRL